jgi:N-acetylglucosaminyldiphosphoundecaprenol N-acetyl-beta-D-mannosaminyltransferase
MARETTRVLGIDIDVVNMQVAVERILTWVREAAPCRYVVTPNLDHAVLYRSSAALRSAYSGAALVVADGAPLVWASRLSVKPLPERVTGSDLTPALFAAAQRTDGLRVFLLGAGPGIAERAASRIEADYPSVRVVGTYSPPPGFEHDTEECGRILERIDAAKAQVLVVGLGAPKQELWVHAHADRLPVSVALCAGATIDFLAGERSRAPRWMQRMGLEWVYRAASDPRRLIPRYSRDAFSLPFLLLSQLRDHRSRRAS